jgi:acetyl esterase
VTDEGVLDPWVVNWIETNPLQATPFDTFDPEILVLARGPYGSPPTRDIAEITDETVEGIPVRIYRGEGEPTGLVVYFHGGGFAIGSIGLMDNVARELAYASGAVVVSVEYRLAPENPYPAGFDDCYAVTQWALANTARFGVPVENVAVAGESAGGHFAAVVALRVRDVGGPALAGQVLLYPGTAGSKAFPSHEEFDGLVLSRSAMHHFWDAYTAGQNLDADPYAAPLLAAKLEGVAPALVVLGGCDMLRDEGRAYAVRLGEAGVDVEEVCYPGQPHGFINHGFPAAAQAFERSGEWLRQAFARSG